MNILVASTGDIGYNYELRSHFYLGCFYGTSILGRATLIRFVLNAILNQRSNDILAANSWNNTFKDCTVNNEVLMYNVA